VSPTTYLLLYETSHPRPVSKKTFPNDLSLSTRPSKVPRLEQGPSFAPGQLRQLTQAGPSNPRPSCQPPWIQSSDPFHTTTEQDPFSSGPLRSVSFASSSRRAMNPSFSCLAPHSSIRTHPLPHHSSQDDPWQAVELTLPSHPNEPIFEQVVLRLSALFDCYQELCFFCALLGHQSDHPEQKCNADLQRATAFNDFRTGLMCPSNGTCYGCGIPSSVSLFFSFSFFYPDLMHLPQTSVQLNGSVHYLHPIKTEKRCPYKTVTLPLLFIAIHHKVIKRSVADLFLTPDFESFSFEQFYEWLYEDHVLGHKPPPFSRVLVLLGFILDHLPARLRPDYW
jgi:hypothetical protein